MHRTTTRRRKGPKVLIKGSGIQGFRAYGLWGLGFEVGGVGFVEFRVCGV